MTDSIPAQKQPQTSGDSRNSSDGSSWLFRHLRKIVVFVIGLTILVFGAIMLILPGPGILVVLGGLGLLATEFAWARQALKWTKQKAQEVGDQAKAIINGGSVPAPSDSSDSQHPSAREPELSPEEERLRAETRSA